MLGFSFAFLAAFFATAKDTCSKKASFSVDPRVSAFASLLLPLPIFIVLLFILWITGYEHFTFGLGFWYLVLARGFFDSLAEMTRMFALKHGELSIVAAILSLHTLITLIISPIITKDPINSQIVTGVIIACVGSLFFVTLTNKINSKGIVFALLGAIFFSIINCLDRLSALSATPVFSAFVMTAIACIFTTPFLFNISKEKIVGDIKLGGKAFLMRAVFEVLFSTSKLTALIYLSTPVNSAILRSVVILSTIAGNQFFHEDRFWPRITGSILIMVGSGIAILG